MATFLEKGPSFGRGQIGLISSKGGPLQPVTRDKNGKEALTLWRNGKVAATVQVRSTHNLTLLAGSGTSGNIPAEPLAQTQDVEMVGWTGEGKILVSDGQSVRRIKADGGLESTLLSDPNSRIVGVAGCGDRYIVLAWAFHGGTNDTEIWRANADGSNLKQLSNEGFGIHPVCSPDAKWVYYYGRAPHFMMKVPLEGGEPQPVPASDVSNMFGGGSVLARSP